MTFPRGSVVDSSTSRGTVPPPVADSVPAAYDQVVVRPDGKSAVAGTVFATRSPSTL